MRLPSGKSVERTGKPWPDTAPEWDIPCKRRGQPFTLRVRLAEYESRGHGTGEATSLGEAADHHVIRMVPLLPAIESSQQLVIEF